MGDRGFDDEEERQKLGNRGIDAELAKRRTLHGSGLGVYLWVVDLNDQLVSSVTPAPCALRSPRRYPSRALLTWPKSFITFRFLDLYGVT